VNFEVNNIDGANRTGRVNIKGTCTNSSANLVHFIDNTNE